MCVCYIYSPRDRDGDLRLSLVKIFEANRFCIREEPFPRPTRRRYFPRDIRYRCTETVAETRYGMHHRSINLIAPHRFWSLRRAEIPCDICLRHATFSLVDVQGVAKARGVKWDSSEIKANNAQRNRREQLMT